MARVIHVTRTPLEGLKTRPLLAAGHHFAAYREISLARSQMQSEPPVDLVLCDYTVATEGDGLRFALLAKQERRKAAICSSDPRHRPDAESGVAFLDPNDPEFFAQILRMIHQPVS